MSCCDIFGKKSVHVAAARGHLDCLKNNVQYAHKKTVLIAAARGHIECLDFLVQNGCPWDEESILFSIHNNMIESVKYLSTVNKNVFVSDFVDISVNLGNFDCVKFFIDSGLCSSDNLIYVEHEFVNNGVQKCLDYISEKGYRHKIIYSDRELVQQPTPLNVLKQRKTLTKSDLLRSCRYGQIDNIRFIIETGFPLSHSAFDSAAKGGHIDCLKFLVENSCPYDANAVMSTVFEGHLDCLEYLCTLPGIVMHPEYMVNATLSGNLECLKSLASKKCKITKECADLAAKWGKFECLKYLIDQGCPWDQETIEEALLNYRFDCLLYLLERLEDSKTKN